MTLQKKTEMLCFFPEILRVNDTSRMCGASGIWKSDRGENQVFTLLALSLVHQL